MECSRTSYFYCQADQLLGVPQDARHMVMWLLFDKMPGLCLLCLIMALYPFSNYVVLSYTDNPRK